jgi:general secretion pathway protein B
MSYILNALKNSESQRSRGEIPHLDSQPAFVTVGASRLSRQLRGWAVALAGLALLLGLVWWQFVAVQQQAPAVSPPAATSPAATATAPASSNSASAVPVAAAESPPGLPALQEMAGVRIRLGEALQPLSMAAETVAAPSAAPPLVLNLPVSGGFVPPAVVPQSVSQPFRAPAGAAPSSEDAPAEQLSGVNHWKTGPAELQKQLRELAFTAHIYSSNPAARFVRVSGRTLHEGEPLGPDMQLLQITRDGLVFSYRGAKFWIGTN